MLALLSRRATPACEALGRTEIARRLDAAVLVPPLAALAVDASGMGRRLPARGRVSAAPGQTLYVFHPGPYVATIVPCAGAPELGLRLHFAVDSQDPRLQRQRFDLYLAAEGPACLRVQDLAAQLEAALRSELAQGHLLLPPCASLQEWQAFRQGLDQLAYTRFGICIDECLPQDLAGTVDFADMLLKHQAQTPAVSAPALPKLSEAQVLRRLFLELPSLCCSLRLADLPAARFRQQLQLVQRLELLQARTEWAQALAHHQPVAQALDQAWALLSRLETIGDSRCGPWFDDAERILSNLEHYCTEQQGPAQGPAPIFA